MSVRILQGDCREILRTLPGASVNCVVTSPPYWGLRDYNVAGQIGLEPTYQEHIGVLVDIFREVRRILRADGVVWLNYGDCYASSVNGRSAEDTKAAGNDDRTFRDKPFSTVGGALKPKDLAMLPARLAIALQEDGWWVRSDIIWHKPNPIPESIRDRPTSSYEHVFLLSKSARYFYDAEAVREESNVPDWDNGTRVYGGKNKNGARTTGRVAGAPRIRGVPPRHAEYESSDRSSLDDVGRGSGRTMRNVWTIATAPFSESHFATFPPELAERCILAGTSAHGVCTKCAAPWVRVTERGEPDIEHQRACGGDTNGNYNGVAQKDYAAVGAQNASDLKRRVLEGMRAIITAGWYPSCRCDGLPGLSAYPREPGADMKEAWALECARIKDDRARLVCAAATIAVAPAVVMDPFFGAGTSGVVADRLRRDCIGIELNSEYAEMSRRRFVRDAGLFAEVATA